MQNKEIISGIYCIENIVNNKKYIGQSKNINDRWRRHKSELNRGNHDNDYLQKSWNKYGESNFSFYILDNCNLSELDEKEKYYIDFYKTLDRNYGYNLKSGGQNNGSIASEYVRQKMSSSLKQAYAKNKELKDKRRQDALNQWANPELKDKISGKNNGMYGKHHSDEAKQKMSEKKKGRPSSKRNTTPVLCIELNQVFDCAVTAAQAMKHKSTAGILEVCKGNRKTAGGYHWKFLLENNIS